jgi:hypothetical protein
MRNLGLGRPGLNPYIVEFVALEILILCCVDTLAILFLVRVLVKISSPTLSVANVYWNWCIPGFYYYSLLFISSSLFSFFFLCSCSFYSLIYIPFLLFFFLYFIHNLTVVYGITYSSIIYYISPN